jgi:endonuclease YncB( thermonuclease family)
MRFGYQILMPLLSLFLVRVDLTDLIPLNIPVKFHKAYDGDTILVSRGSYFLKVRLIHIDSPEKDQLFLNSHISAGEASLQCLKEALKFEQSLLLTVHGFDIYRRILGDVNGLSYRLIQRGCTSLYPQARFSSRGEMFRYLTAFKYAQVTRRGLWGAGNYLLPKKWRTLNKRYVRRH